MAIAGTGLLCAQSLERRATFRPGGDRDHGKCTVDVVVDGAADVEIRGDTAVLRNLSGRPPQWRRFECTGPLPANPADFRFAGQEGRGRQQLIRDPRNGGVAVVRIEDRDNGAEGYKFDIMWSGSAGYPTGRDNRDYRNDGDNRGDRDQGFNRDRDARDSRDQDSFYRDRDDRFRAPDFRQRFFQQIRQDLNHVQSVTFPLGADQYRISRTLQELDQLQDKLARGRYDERELNDVIDAMQRVVRDNRLSRRDRDILADDLNRLRDFRARHESYGAR
jgi:hypothetical protein